MIDINGTATSLATRPCMPALLGDSGIGTSVEGRRMAAGYVTRHFGVRVPAFLKDVVPGVRAWSPPV